VEHETSHPILLYDGVCGLCNRGVRFLLKRERASLFRFASLQSALASRILTRHGASPSNLDTFYVVVGLALSLPIGTVHNERLLARSDAVICVLQELGGAWRGVALMLRLLPRPVRDWTYNFVARRRYRIFGQYETCPVPSEATRARFLDL